MSHFGQPFPFHPQHVYQGRRGPFPSTTPHPFQYLQPSPPMYETDFYPHHDAYSFGYARPAPTPAPYDANIDAEERAALAHLQAIRERRAATEARLNREAREAEIRAERELAFQAVLQKEREAKLKMEQAMRRDAIQRERLLAQQREAVQLHRAQQEQQRRAEAIARAQTVEAYKNRLATIAKAKACAFAQAQAQQLARQASLAAQEKKRQYCQRIKEEQARRKACAEHCARRAEAVKENEDKSGSEDDGLKIINDLLNGFFGINLVPETDVATKPKEAPVTTDVKPAPVATETKPVPVATETKPAPVATEAPTKSSEDAAFPSDINDIISHFLGLRVDPAKDGETAIGQPDKNVIGGLNQLLGQFGLEFEPAPTTDAQPQASGSGSSAPVNTSKPVDTPVPAEETSKPAATPIADFLNGHYEIPSFVRDILSNVEVALTQGQDFKSEPEPEVQGKGKGVAEGEKPVKPAKVPELHFESATPAETVETVSSSASIDKLDTIAHELYLATESFEFPQKLVFAPNNNEQPQLLFNKTNSGYHAQAHKLLQLLLAADGVSSGGDKDVRRKRKDVVRAVECAIEALEKKRDDLWDQVKVKRDVGEESDVEDGDSSAASTRSDIEHVELGDFEDHENKQSTQEPVKGFEVADEPGEVVFDAEETEKAVKDSLEIEQHVTEEEKDDSPVPQHEEKPESLTPAPKSPSTRSVTVEDAEEGFEVL